MAADEIHHLADKRPMVCCRRRTGHPRWRCSHPGVHERRPGGIVVRSNLDRSDASRVLGWRRADSGMDLDNWLDAPYLWAPSPRVRSVQVVATTVMGVGGFGS